MTPNELIDFLRALELKLASSEVDRRFEKESKSTQNELALLQLDIGRLVNVLTVERLESKASKLQDHSKQISLRIEKLKEELDSLKSARKLLTQLRKNVEVLGRIAIYFV